MIDIRSEWTNTYLKFRLLADHTDVIVGVTEHAQGCFLVEQGYFTALEEYFAKTHVFKHDVQYDRCGRDRHKRSRRESLQWNADRDLRDAQRC